MLVTANCNCGTASGYGCRCHAEELAQRCCQRRLQSLTFRRSQPSALIHARTAEHSAFNIQTAQPGAHTAPPQTHTCIIKTHRPISQPSLYTPLRMPAMALVQLGQTKPLNCPQNRRRRPRKNAALEEAIRRVRGARAGRASDEPVAVRRTEGSESKKKCALVWSRCRLKPFV